MPTAQWNTVGFSAVGGLAAAMLVFQLLPAAINALAPTATAVAGPITSLIYSASIVLCLLTLRRTGSATLMLSIYAVMALPLFLLGPPGFLAKVPIAMVGGIICDILYLVTKKKSVLVALFATGPFQYYLAWVLVQASAIVEIPGMEQAARLLYTPVVIVGSIVVGAAGGLLGLLLYKQFEGTAVVARIQASQVAAE